MKARRGGVPKTRSSSLSHIQSIPSTAAPSITKLPDLENRYARVYKQWKIENDEYRRSVDDYQQHGADGYELGGKPAKLRKLENQLSGIKQRIDALKLPRVYTTYDPDAIALGDL
jgi:hypothetical protein